MKGQSIALFFSIFTAYFQAFAEPWNLPQLLTAANTKVTFEVDSTWHLVKGEAKHIDGRVWLEDPKDFKSIRAKVRLPVSAFDTGKEGRDEKMRRVMHTDAAPDVIFSFEQSIDICDPKLVSAAAPCRVELPGELIINNVIKNVVVHAEIEKLADAFRITGTTLFKWSDFGVEDPSILIAKLDEDVKVDFVVSLNPKG